MKMSSFVLVLFVFFNFSAYAQESEEKILSYTRFGLLEVSSQKENKEDNTTNRIITVSLQGKIVTRFNTENGYVLDVVATYLSAYEGDYVVLRTDQGQGACVRTSLYVLKINAPEMLTSKNKSLVEVSPLLNECMGEVPTIKFEVNPNIKTNDSILISVFDYVLLNNKWFKKNTNIRKKRSKK